MKIRHILGISGGKDSAALAIHLRDRIPEMEYVFCDTGKELPETYEFIDRLEVYLNRHIVRLPKELPGYSEKFDFDHWLEMFGGLLPSSNVRWCTKNLKLKPFEKYLANDTVFNYVGIRADEFREGYISHKPNITTVFPFRDDGIDKQGVLQILEDAGLGLPKYYEWRSRSGCYFCFYQTKREWVGLKERHPEKFEEAKAYEKDGFHWRQDISLAELDNPEVVSAFRTTVASPAANGRPRPGASLREVFDTVDEEEIEKPCLICHL